MSTRSSGLDGPDKHDEYWFETGDLILLVDEVYFKVHRELLARTSGLIKDMLGMPVGEGKGQAEGTTLDNAVVIPEVPYQHFEAILHAAYGRFEPPSIDLNPENVSDGSLDKGATPASLVSLIRTAHRLQAPEIIVPIAEAVLSYLQPVERFVLCRDLGLDEIRSRHEQEHNKERLRLQNAINSRNERRGVQCQLGSSHRAHLPKSAAKQWLMEAFTAVVLAPQVKIPSSELGDKIGLHIMLARQRLAELRVSTVDQWIDSKSSFSRGDILCVSNIWRLQRDEVKHQYSSSSQSYPAPAYQIVKGALPSLEEEHAVVRSYWEAVNM